MNNVSRINDSINGTCFGTYRYWGITGYTPTWYDPETGDGGGGNPIYGWLYASESGTTTGKLSSGSSNVFVNNRGIARVGDSVNIHKNYANSDHLDPIDIIGTISSGKSNVYANGKNIAFKGSTVAAEGCNVVINEGSSNVFC